MAKKKSHKKQSFKYGEASATSVSPATTAVSKVASSGSTSAAVPVATFEHPYLTADMRRLLVVGGGLVVLELVLWYLFGHTGLGSSIYNLYQIGA